MQSIWWAFLGAALLLVIVPDTILQSFGLNSTTYSYRSERSEQLSVFSIGS